MKTITEVLCVFVLGTLMSVAGQDKKELGGFTQEEVKAAIGRTRERQQENLVRIEELERRNKALLEDTEDNLDMDVSSVVDMLLEISRSSTRDLRYLIQHEKRESEKALKRAEQDLKDEEENKVQLEIRWQHANMKLQRSKEKLKAIGRAMVQYAQTMANKINTTLEEVESLHSFRNKIDLQTEAVRSHRKGSSQQKNTPVEADPVRQSSDLDPNNKDHTDTVHHNEPQDNTGSPDYYDYSTDEGDPEDVSDPIEPNESQELPHDTTLKDDPMNDTDGDDKTEHSGPKQKSYKFMMCLYYILFLVLTLFRMIVRLYLQSHHVVSH